MAGQREELYSLKGATVPYRYAHPDIQLLLINTLPTTLCGQHFADNTLPTTIVDLWDYVGTMVSIHTLARAAAATEELVTQYGG